MMVMTLSALLSNRRASSLTSFEKEGEDPVDVPHQSRLLLRPHDHVLPVVEPDLDQEHHHEVPGVDEAEHRHRGARLRGQEDLVGPERMAQVRHQRQRGDEQEGQRREKGEPVKGLDLLDVEDLDERGQDERPRDDPGDVRVHDDKEAPVDFDLVGVDVPRDLRQKFAQLFHHVRAHRTSPSILA